MLSQGCPIISFKVPDVYTCGCIRYDIYCQQPKDDHPYQENARKFCESDGGSLAILNTKEIDDLIREKILAHDDYLKACIPKHGFWIGLIDGDGDDEGNYVWDAGYCPATHFNWAPNEPDNNTKQNPESGQDCVQMWFRPPKSEGQWDDEYCDHRPKGFICQHEVDCY
ncbi:lectin-like [Glandiceps talaboti]